MKEGRTNRPSPRSGGPATGGAVDMDHGFPEGWFPAPSLALGSQERSILTALRLAIRAVGDIGFAMGDPPSTLGSQTQENALYVRGILSGLADINCALQQTGYRGWQMEPPGSLGITRDERRFLRAVKVAGTGDRRLLDNYLFKLALDRKLRMKLALIIQSIAAWGQGMPDGSPQTASSSCKAVSCAAHPGLPSPGPIRGHGILPAPALAALRARGCSPDNLIIDWIGEQA
ncbi:Hypothetical protein GbCGDNIH9_0042 [Granulibacter bethesdensis]|uniref:Uncharacterized protein n=2 Tax=Granulibacter bethesdensis TaxID=364410 RepID=A0AAC9K8D3_9PROT|nr:Hypothetical protein GbCGDNIH9_0042 [Granulibacter bethesdensis]APH60839.1 Hypothetical protein GbCGDNIH8_0042 [Granulibacter bethesdensis]